MARQRVGKILNIVVFICVIFIFLLVFLLAFFAKDVFSYNTYINGVECSFYSIDGAKNKLERVMNNSQITLLFADNKEYTCLGAHFEIKINNLDSLEEVMKKQSENTGKETNYDLQDLFTVNEDKVKKYLQSLSIFRENNIRKTQNATLELDKNNRLYIKPEVYGNEINLDEACDFMIKSLKAGKTVIDFKEITNMNPKILSTDKKLIEQKENINEILSTTIKYNLYDGSTLTLDSNTMKDWIYQSDDGYYGIDIDKNVTKFVDLLAKKSKYSLTSTKFRATGIGVINISFGKKKYATINKEKEIDRIKEQLSSKKDAKFDPIYNQLPDYLNINTYVELDLNRQHIWMYVNGKCIVESPFVSGNVAGGYATPVGIYYLTYKTTNTFLEGYNGDGSKYSSFVNYWMPFNGGIGLHDATWRSKFGGNIYLTNGSHGCINLPYSVAQKIYNNINTSIPIILYNS